MSGGCGELVGDVTGYGYCLRFYSKIETIAARIPTTEVIVALGLQQTAFYT